MAYGSYDEYAAMYGADDLSEERYSAALPRATALLDTFTGRRAQRATGYTLDAVKRAECGLARMIARQDETGQGTGVKSVSNEGYSETYGADTPEKAHADLRAACFQWLSGTGLMSAL